MIFLKGIKSGFLRCVVTDDMSEKKMLEEFDDLTANGKNLLDGSSVIIDMQNRNFGAALVGKIWKNFIEPTGCGVLSWVVADPDTRICLNKIGLHTGEPPLSATAERSGIQANSPKAFLYTGTLRGGQKIEHDGDVIVAGHVNMGAEVYAEGHVIILGRLKGLVHAGCRGDENVSVAVRAFESSQIRIGTKVGLVEKDSDIWKKAVVVTVSGDEVLLTEWPVL